jgi:hypothetical protein
MIPSLFGLLFHCIIMYAFFHILLLLFEFKYIFIRSTANSLLCLSYLLLWYFLCTIFKE